MTLSSAERDELFKGDLDALYSVGYRKPIAP